MGNTMVMGCDKVKGKLVITVVMTGQASDILKLELNQFDFNHGS